VGGSPGACLGPHAPAELPGLARDGPGWPGRVHRHPRRRRLRWLRATVVRRCQGGARPVQHATVRVLRLMAWAAKGWRARMRWRQRAHGHGMAMPARDGGSE
jgi:hypothetical protein